MHCQQEINPAGFFYLDADKYKCTLNEWEKAYRRNVLLFFSLQLKEINPPKKLEGNKVFILSESLYFIDFPQVGDLTIGRSINTTTGVNIVEGPDEITLYISGLFDLFKMRCYPARPPSVSLRKLNVGVGGNSFLSSNG